MTNWIIHGLICINHEEEGYSSITFYGRTDPKLKIPPDNDTYVALGWKRLTAIYTDDEKQVYAGTLSRTLLYFGAKVWINCPDLFHIEGDTDITLRADLFANNRRVPGNYGKFQYNHKTVSPKKQVVAHGHAEETHKKLNLFDKSEYSFQYELCEQYKLSEDEGKGMVYIYTVPKGKIPLQIDVPTTILNFDQEGRLSARVYHKNRESNEIGLNDVPPSGYLVFYIDGKRLQTNTGKYKFNISPNGFASIPFTPTLKEKWEKGTHNITASFNVDTPELQEKYVSTNGSGTLYIGDDTNYPTLTSTTPWCTSKDSSKTLTFLTNKKIKGKISLYIDYEKVPLIGCDENKELTINVNANQTFEISFDAPDTLPSDECHWNYGGYHVISLLYSLNDGGDYPMEYISYFKDFYIQSPISLVIDGEPDINTYGNNFYYLEGDTIKHHISEKKPSTVIGHKLTINVTNEEHKEDIVNEGYVRVTFVSRNNEENMEENTNI